MKIILFSRARAPHSADEVRRIFDAMDRYGFDFAVNEEFAPELTALTGRTIAAQSVYGAQVGVQPSEAIMVCYGGDGTLLEGAHRLRGAAIPVVGINSGHLGFLTSTPTSEIDELFADIAAANIRIEPRTVVEVAGDFAQTPDSVLALNEFSIQRHGAGMIAVETYVDDQMVATYRGDGVLLCTPTGSTAYSLSAGGPVVAPQCGCLVISPLAPHNLTMRPVVIPDTSCVRMCIRARQADAFVTLDDRIYPVREGAEFTIRRSAHPIFLAVSHNISFYDTLRNKMMWGVDIRGEMQE
ncbi:MAG: NAD(+)/NADH kinase [Alistipes sp.]